MQLNILKIKTILLISLVTILISNCNRKSDLENQITIKINSIDNETKQPRINTFDTIEIRIKKFGYLMKRFVKVGECITDSKGSVKIKVDRTEENHFILGGPNVYGATEFAEGELKDGQEVNIEVISLENR